MTVFHALAHRIDCIWAFGEKPGKLSLKYFIEKSICNTLCAVSCSAYSIVYCTVHKFIYMWERLPNVDCVKRWLPISDKTKLALLEFRYNTEIGFAWISVFRYSKNHWKQFRYFGNIDIRISIFPTLLATDCSKFASGLKQQLLFITIRF